MESLKVNPKPFNSGPSSPPTSPALRTSDPLDTKLPYQPFKGWKPLPTEDLPSMAVELFGDWATGKTHFASTFPSPALCDTELKGWVVWKKVGNPRYWQAKDWGEVLAFTEHCIASPDVKTLVFDSSKDVRDYAEQWTLGETGKKSLVSKVGDRVITVQFSMVYRKLDALVHDCREAGKNVVFTSRVKQDWVDNVNTGRMIRDGYNKAPFQFDVVLQLRMGIPNMAGRVLYPKHIFGQVHKAGWMHQAEWPPYLIDCSYDGIVKELFHGGWSATGTLNDFITERVKPVMDGLGIKEGG